MVRTGRSAAEDTPVQSGLNLTEGGTAVLEDRYLDAVDGLSAFSHLWLLTWLASVTDDVLDPVSLRQVPFLAGPGGPDLGVFAMRGPRRPNPIGLSLVEVVDVARCSIGFRGVDMVDGTPLLDVKPFVERFDAPATPVRCGWFDGIDLPEGATPASLRGPQRS